MSLVAQRVARCCVLQFRDCPDVAGVEFLEWDLLFAAQSV
jgi:hypothetical protein